MIFKNDLDNLAISIRKTLGLESYALDKIKKKK